MMRGEYGTYEVDTEMYGKEMHKALIEMSGRLTIPNVYIGGQNVGGDEETEDLADNGRLRTMLDNLGI